MSIGIANLRISYLGGGYDFPEFFREQPVYILAGGLAVEVRDSGQFPCEIAVLDVLVYRQHQAQNRPKTTSIIQGGTNA